MDISTFRERIAPVCATHAVEYLYLFGSNARGEGNSKSDYDFLVKFREIDPLDYFDNYFSFKESLEKELGCKVDVVESQTLSNPYLIKSIEKDKIPIYGFERKEMAV